jgi:hypothetical protein
VSVQQFDPALPPLDEATARRHAADLRALAAEHGITNLRFASPGRLVGTAGSDETYDPDEFELAVIDRLHVEVTFIADRVLSKPGVSGDLLTATAL